MHGLVAQKRRAGVGTLLATAGARAWPTLHARGRAVCRTVRIITRTTRTCPKIRDLILKCTKTHESAQLGMGPRYASSSWRYWLWRRAGENIVIKQSNAAQKSKNQIPLVIPPYHTTPKKNQNNQNTGSIPVNVPHCLCDCASPPSCCDVRAATREMSACTLPAGARTGCLAETLCAPRCVGCVRWGAGTKV